VLLWLFSGQLGYLQPSHGCVIKKPGDVSVPGFLNNAIYKTALLLLGKTLDSVNARNLLREELPLWVKQTKAFKLSLKQAHILIERREI
jgi:hypothetical protein